MTETASSHQIAEGLARRSEHEIPGNPLDKALDDLVHLAAYICRTPIALISVIDSDRQWFKSKVALSQTQTASIIAFCAHAMLGNDLFVVPDALAEERFSTNPLVTGESQIRFFCGVPLTTPERQRIGTLSVIDQVPRNLSAEQVEALRMLGWQAVHHMIMSRQDRELTQAGRQRGMAEQALRVSRQQMDAILENSPLPVLIKDRDGRYVLTNREFDQAFGLPTGYAIGKTDTELFSPEQAAIFRANDQKVIQAGIPMQFEERAWYVDGRHTDLVAKFPIRDSLNEIVAIGGIVMDITDRKRAEEEMLRVVEAMPNALVRVNPAGLITLVNTRMEMLFGYTREELMGRAIEDLIPDRYRQAHAGQRAGFFSVPTSRPVGAGRDLYGLHKDGREIPIEVGLNPIATPDPPAVLASVIDITERKAAERALRESEERFRLVAEVTNDVLWDWDLVTDEFWWSPNAHEKFGYDPAKESTIRAWSARLHPDERERVLRDMGETIKSGKRISIEWYRFRLADRSYGFFVTKGQVIRDARGKPVRMIGAMIDETVAKRAFSSLKKANEQLQEMGRDLQMAEENERRRLSRELHDEFGQILSALKLHIARASEGILSRRKPQGAVLRKHVMNAEKAVDRLFSSLREMIHGLRPAILEELGLVAALQEQAGELREAGIQCRVLADRDDFGSLLGVELEGALYRIGQELLTNVLRHAKATVASLTVISADGRVILTVRDNGRGFPAGFTLPKDRFGLMGMRERAELLGGRLDVQSKSGRGTVATVDFPIASTMREQGSSGSFSFVVRATGKKRQRHGK